MYRIKQAFETAKINAIGPWSVARTKQVMTPIDGPKPHWDKESTDSGPPHPSMSLMHSHSRDLEHSPEALCCLEQYAGNHHDWQQEGMWTSNSSPAPFIFPPYLQIFTSFNTEECVEEWSRSHLGYSMWPSDPPKCGIAKSTAPYAANREINR